MKEWLTTLDHDHDCGHTQPDPNCETCKTGMWVEMDRPPCRENPSDPAWQDWMDKDEGLARAWVHTQQRVRAGLPAYPPRFYEMIAEGKKIIAAEQERRARLGPKT
jgi:hypothetical protein